MNGNGWTLDAFLYENRISPAPEFSAAIDLTCNQIRRREAKAMRIEAGERAKKRRFQRSLRWLVSAAAVIVVFVTLLSIPSVSQAMRSWFGDLFRLNDYMAAEPENREDNADIAGAVQTPVPAQTSFSLRYLDETEYAEGVNEWRLSNGFAAFNREDYAWVADLQPQTDEILYDGRNLIVNTRINASPTRFLGTYGGEGERFDLWTSSVSVTANGQPFTDFADQGGGLVLKSFQNTDGSGYDMEKASTADSVLEQTTLIGNNSPAFPAGPVTVTIEMWLVDGEIDNMATVGLVAVLTQTVTFDAAEGNEKLASAESVTKQLCGVAPLTIDGDGTLENRMFDYSAVTVSASIERRATGVSVTIHYSFPTEEEKTRLWKSIVLGTVGHSGVQYEAIVDGQSIGKIWHASDYLGMWDDPVLEIPLTESELASVQSITLRPIVRYISSYTSGGAEYTDMPFDEILTLVQYGAQYTEVPLEGCDIVIPLN
jgi:hypothetical protein